MRLEDLRKLAEARTKGEWVVEVPVDLSQKSEGFIRNMYVESNAYPRIGHGVEEYGGWSIPFFYDYEEAGVPRLDAEFIAAFANHAEALLNVVEAAKYAYAQGDEQYHEIQNLGEALAKLEATR